MKEPQSKRFQTYRHTIGQLSRSQLHVLCAKKEPGGRDLQVVVMEAAEEKTRPWLSAATGGGGWSGRLTSSIVTSLDYVPSRVMRLLLLLTAAASQVVASTGGVSGTDPFLSHEQ